MFDPDLLLQGWLAFMFGTRLRCYEITGVMVFGMGLLLAPTTRA
jgi:hypothetical protein